MQDWRRRVAVGIGLAIGMMIGGSVSVNYVEVNLVSDGGVPGAVRDTHLINPWGMAASATGPFWVSDNGSGEATLYDGNTGLPLSLVVTIPPPPGSPADSLSTPTGQVFNNSSSFVINDANGMGPSTFLFATEDGGIAAWKGGNPAPTSAIRVIDNSGAGFVYKGLAMATDEFGTFIYAANSTTGGISIFNESFIPAGFIHGTGSPGSFIDPNLPSGYAPFNIQNLGGDLYVTYAQRDPADPAEELPGAGLGIVDVFTPEGALIRRLLTGGVLNAPWGLALAPANFGEFSNALLVGNFGDGRINAFDAATGALLGTLTDAADLPIEIEGLWALQFGNDGSAGKRNELFFTAGINDEAGGLFGKLLAALEVSIDIKPASGDNNFRPSGKEVLPVAILTTDTFDATTIDPLSVRFGPGGATASHGMGRIADVDKDGDLDLLLQFRTLDAGIACGATFASLTGRTFGGQVIAGSDSVSTVRCN
jgi:uncharacterized protein (TIGR03118 family)